MIEEQRSRLQMVGSYAKGVLEGREVVHVHRQHPVDPNRLDDTREVARSHGIARLRLAVLALIAKIGHDGRDTSRGRVAKGSAEEDEPAELVVDAQVGRVVHRLQHVDVLVANVDQRTRGVLAVVELVFGVRAQGRSEGGSDGVPEVAGFAEGEEVEVVRHAALAE